MHVPLLDLKAQYAPIKSDVDHAVAEVFASQMFINGPQVKACEQAIAEYCQTPYATGVSSGSDALILVLMAEKIGAGDEVITPAYSFFATAGAVSRVGAKPVFVDIDPRTYNIDPAAIEAAITPRTKAIIPVHLFGQMADMDAIMAIAEKHNLIVIEDSAQSIGAEYKGKRSGSIGHYGCYSFFPSKNLGCAGDGGIVSTNTAERDEMLKTFRNHGAKIKYHHIFVGGNFRLDTIHAAVVLAKLPHLESWHIGRQQNAKRYRKLFEQAGVVGKGVISLPFEIESRHIYNQFVIRVERRDELMAFLKANDIGCEVYYPFAFHELECFAPLGYQPGDFPQSEAAARETLAIPIYPELSAEQQEYVVDTIARFYRV
ncbi:MAG: DegT/DnrJ/EryC1/StrS family aminotransferase [bacterium]|nr:DegT/DnrJ/EryC1/StrS family aminotransferase [bacterium]